MTDDFLKLVIYLRTVDFLGGVSVIPLGNNQQF